MSYDDENLPDVSEELDNIFSLESELDYDFTNLGSSVDGILKKSKSNYMHSDIINSLKKVNKNNVKIIPKKFSLKNSGFRLLLMGIPFPINSGVVTVMKNTIKAFVSHGANVVIVNHWWHKYSFFNKKTDSYVSVKLSPYCLLNEEGSLIKLKWALKNILVDLRDKYRYYPQICHVHTHTFYEDKSIQIFNDYFPNTKIVYTLHAFLPYLKLSREDKLRLLQDQMSREEIEKIRKEGYRGREISQEGMIKLANKVITISQVHKDAFDRIYPEFRHKCVNIPNGTDFELYSELKEVVNKAHELRLSVAPKNERIVIYVGRLEEQKGAKRLVEGFNLIAAKYPDTKLVIIGEDDSKLNMMFTLGLKNEFRSRVHFAGWVKDRKILAAYYRIADVMVQPVFSKELYAMVTLEAMTLKVPVISCPGNLTVGTCETPESILRAVDLIFADRSAINRHLDNAKEVVIREYSLNAIYKKHMALYNELLGK